MSVNCFSFIFKSSYQLRLIQGLACVRSTQFEVLIQSAKAMLRVHLLTFVSPVPRHHVRQLISNFAWQWIMVRAVDGSGTSSKK